MTHAARNASPEIVTYKNRKYRCLYLGSTKYGQRAKLAFFDGTREFWVDAALVAGAHSSAGRDSYGNRIYTGESYQQGVTAPHGRTCPMCGSRECSRAWDPRALCDED